MADPLEGQLDDFWYIAPFLCRLHLNQKSQKVVISALGLHPEVLKRCLEKRSAPQVMCPFIFVKI